MVGFHIKGWVMSVCVEWTLFLHVATAEKCQRVVEKISVALGLPLDIRKADPYWKDASLFKVDAKSCIDAPNNQDAFYRILKAANGVSLRWTVTGPYEGQAWEFAGTADEQSIRIQGVKSMSFSSSSNVELPEQMPTTLRAS